MRRAVRTAGIAVLVAALLAGCAASRPSPAPSPTAGTAQAEPDDTAASPAEATPRSRAEAAVAQMDITERAASIVMGHVPSTDPAVLRASMEAGLGGFILMGANIDGGPEQVRALTQALTIDPDLPPLIAVDQEGGVVSRLSWDDLPAGRQLQHADPVEVEHAFQQRAALLADVGINVNFGIVADVPAGPESFIASRALGADPEAAAMRVAAAVDGERGTVLSTLKHFPGHGAAPGDSHHAIPATDLTLQGWRSADAQPFAAGIDAGAELLMFGHLAYTAVDSAPASLSAQWHRIARDDLGFSGVMITDDLGMLVSSGIDSYRDPVRNAVDAVTAGNDMVLTVAGSTPETAPAVVAGIVAAVEAGELPPERLQDAAERVMELRLRLAEGIR